MSGPAEPDFRLTYASMFDPPPALHQRFDAALRQVRAELGGEHAMTIDGRALSDAELLTLVNGEQRRQGRKIVETLEQGARDMADKVRAGIGQ